VVVNGQIAGTWKRKLTKNAVIMETNLFSTLSEPENRAVNAAIQRYGEFLNLPVVAS